MKALKAFIKPFETPQRSVKIKIYVYFFFLRDRDGKGLMNLSEYVNKLTIRLLIISGEIEINSNNGAGDRIFVNFFTFSSVKSVMKGFVGNFIEFSLFKDFILESRQVRCGDVFNVNFEHISHLFACTLNKQMLAGKYLGFIHYEIIFNGVIYKPNKLNSFYT